MINFVAIPHRRRAYLRQFADTDAFMTYAVAYAATSGRPEPDDVTDAAFTVGDDLHSWHLIQSRADLDFARDHITPHQRGAVSVLLDSLEADYVAQ